MEKLPKTRNQFNKMTDNYLTNIKTMFSYLKRQFYYKNGLNDLNNLYYEKKRNIRQKKINEVGGKNIKLRKIDLYKEQSSIFSEDLIKYFLGIYILFFILLFFILKVHKKLKQFWVIVYLLTVISMPILLFKGYKKGLYLGLDNYKISYDYFVLFWLLSVIAGIFASLKVYIVDDIPSMKNLNLSPSFKEETKIKPVVNKTQISKPSKTGIYI